MNSTALGAENIIFISEAHERFFHEKLKEVRYQDAYHKALVYCLGISEDTRRNVYNIYDFKSGCVKTDCLHEGWQTSGSARVVRMAFNLYCNGMPSVSDYDDAEEQLNESRQYSAEELFCCAYAPFFWCELHITTPKTAAGCRTIPMLGEVRKALLQERKRQMREGGSTAEIDGYTDFVFTNRFGYVHNPQTINRAIERIYTAANEKEAAKAKEEHRKPLVIRHFSVHNLRHTFCTRFCKMKQI